jgi:hypothetical protein
MDEKTTTSQTYNADAANTVSSSAQGLSLWIDSNVLLDISSDYQVMKNAPAGDHAVEETRMLMQRAHWLGLALDEQSARTISFRVETMGNLLRYAPPGSDGASFISAFVWIERAYVCPKWGAHLTARGTTVSENGHERKTTNDERDQFMVDEAKANGLEVITRDKGARNKAIAAGVPVSSPAEYALRVLSFEAARERFFERAEVGVLEWAKNNGGSTPQNQKAVEVLWKLYSAIWAPADAFFPRAA